MSKTETKSNSIVFEEPTEVDASTVSDGQLDQMKLDRAKDIAEVVAKLCAQAKRQDSSAILQHIVDDMDQLFMVGQETGRRLERDKTT